jgi:prostaglandin-H2 D-isomerase / glutathione transferase
LKADEILDYVEDVIHLLSPSLREQDADKKAELRANLATNVLPTQFANLEKVLERNKSNPFALGSDLSIADLKLGVLLVWIRSGKLDGIPASLVDSHARVAALVDAYAAHPKIQEWNAAHPQ